MLLEEVFATRLERNEDFNQSDFSRAVLRLDQRQTALQEHLYYGLPLDHYLDLLNDQGYDPVAYLQIVERNTEIILRDEIWLEDLDFLPD